VLVANSVGMTTRLEVDTMRSIAKKFTEEGVKGAFVYALNSRLVLRITEKYNQRSNVMTFADAIGSFGNFIKEENLLEA
jgi:hypothetical protein